MTDALKTALARDARLLEVSLAGIYEQINEPETALVREAEVYSLMAGGKRIRPFLVTEFCLAFGGTREAALPFAQAVEMMHTFSLIHDDMPCMDDDDLRRGRPTNHKVYGEATALLAGDSLSIRAIETAMNNRFVPAATALEGALALARAAGSEGMIGGQILDMRGEKETLDYDTLLTLHRKKTGAMITVSALLGCLAAGLDADDEKTRASCAYAADIGLAFQVIDDILDATATAEELGKSVGGDAEHHKITFLTFMSIPEAYSYAERLTGHAIAALAPYEGCGLLCDLARYLLARKN